MILEGPVIDLLDVQILVPGGGFILGRSYLNVDDLGAGDEELQWTSYLSAAKGVSIQRGGKRKGVSNTIDVGSLAVTLVGTGDPTDEPNMIPNTPIRLLSKLTGRRLYTGAISDVDMTHQLDKRTGKITTFVTITAVDGVQAHANTTRYGAIAEGGFERWENRIQRLAASSVVAINPPAVNEPIVRYSI